MSKVKIIWQDEKPSYEGTSKEELMKNSTSITINL